jgi:perosamine synthetase
MKPEIRMSAPDIDLDDQRAVVDALTSGVLSLGPRVEEFERLGAGVAGVEHGVAVSSGTAGLHLLTRGLGLGHGDDVLVPSFTFVATVNACLYEGATPVFVDIEPDTFNLDTAQLSSRRTPATKAVVVVDAFGHPADWDRIRSITEDLIVIDDCCEAIGSTFRGKPLGGFGTAGCFAFYPNKQMTTGEGGLIVTNDDRLAKLCRSLRNQGRDDVGTWLEHPRMGFNYRMDELSAALGTSQIRRLGTFVAKRDKVAGWYTERLTGKEWMRPPSVREDVTMSWFAYVVTLSPEIDRRAVVETLRADGIPTRAYFSPVHLQPYIRERFHTREGMLPITEDVSRRTLALPFHNNLTEQQVQRIVEGLEHAIRVRGRG